MSNELSELIALGCPDLTSQPEGSQQIELLFNGQQRRLSIKQMTATELANLRAAAAAEAEAQAQAQAEAEARAAKEENQRLAAAAEAKARARAAIEVEAQLRRVMELDKQRQSEMNAKPLDRFVLDDAMEMHLLNASDAQVPVIESFPAKSDSQLTDSIELLRQQRAARDVRSHNHSRERSISPADRNRERSAAPNRLHSSSMSSMESNSVSASGSGSKTTSRRGSTTSAINESAAEQTPAAPKFPITKTVSAPNMNRRLSSLSSMFPGPSPLVAPEPCLHTNPNALPEVEHRSGRQEDGYREIPSGKMVHRTKTPPPVGANLGVCLKRVTNPSGSIAIKPKESPMLGVVLRKVERKTVQQKSILDDEKPLYHFSIVRSDHKEHVSAQKPKPKPAPPAGKPNPGGILTGPQGIRTVNPQAKQPVPLKPQRPQVGVPITITKIEGDKIIIIKKIIVPKNSKIPEQYLQVGDSRQRRDRPIDRRLWCPVRLVYSPPCVLFKLL